ncbi:MAG TPA: ATP-binding protein [Gaiellaceae bacterium]|nr:ATP-binding protein [Gaiellaceae bacterium]
MGAAARAYLLLGLALTAVYVAVGGSELIYVGVGTSAWLAVLVGIARNRPRRRLGWQLFALSQLCANVGDAVYFFGYHRPAPFPSLADPLYQLGSVSAAATLLILIGGAGRKERAALVEAGVLSLAVGLLLWAGFFGQGLGAGTASETAASVAYPVLDMVLLAIIVRVFLAHGRRTVSYYAVLAALLLLILSNAWYVIPALTDRYVAGTWRDVGWLASYVLAGYAALHPSMRVFLRRSSDLKPGRRVMLLGGSMVLLAIAALVQQAVQGRVDVAIFGAVGIAMAVLVTVRIVGLVRELEAMRVKAEESERRFRMVFERAPIGISVGRNGIMSETNPALQRMLGYTAGELQRMHYTEVTHPDAQDLVEQQELDAGKRDSFHLDKLYRGKDGRTIETHVHVALDLDDGLGISLIEDVSERRELEEQLRQAQKMEAIGKLAGGVAHDFNNLMTAVLGYSDLVLKRLPPGDPNREKVEAIRESSIRASDLTRQLLAFGRRQMLQIADLDLRDVLARMDSLLRRLIGEDVVLVTLSGDEPVVIRGDHTQLEQVVVNLAVNARDAMPTGGTLTIEVAADEDAAVLTVADTGVGMDAETAERIFEPFFTTKAVGEGTGLGLSTVHGIVGQSGGAIEVETEPGRGTRFTVRLPLAGRVLPQPPPAATLVD